MAVKMLTVVFWVMMPCSLAGGYSFRGTYCFTYKLKEEAVCSSETFVTNYKTKQCHSPEDNIQCVKLVSSSVTDCYVL
jgi:hypothetical protein